jgi:predicted AlkP superfamily pyrophosphatase or phosphodiesterase
VVLSGGTWVKDRVVTASGSTNEGDDTASFPGQAEAVDVAPTIAWALGLQPPSGSQGRVLSEAFVQSPRAAQRAGRITEPIANRGAIFIYDGNNSTEVWCLVKPSTCGTPTPAQATDPAFVPNLEALAASGTLLRYGSIAGWPSVTFPNHNTIGSGAYPGHTDMVNNRFYIRETRVYESPIDPQDPDNPLFINTSHLLADDIETLHEAVHRSFGDWTPADGPTSQKAFTASVDEPSARGADYATLEPLDSFPDPAVYIGTQVPSELAADTTQSCAQSDPTGYGQESALDHIGQTQFRRLFEDPAQHPVPRYAINNFTLTDGAGHHFGPHTTCAMAAYRDSDRRLGRILATLRETGVLGEMLIVITGDHGMENQDLSRRGLPSDFESKLNAAGIEHVMADWHVYLLTLDLASSVATFTDGVTKTATFTVTDDDTGDPVEGSTVTVTGVASSPVSGTTDAAGKVTLTFRPTGSTLTVTATADGFNPGARTFPVKTG